MFKERAVFGNSNRFDQMRRQVIKANSFSSAVAFSSDRAEHFRLEAYFFFFGVRCAVSNGGDALFIESNCHGWKGLSAVDQGASAGLDHKRCSVNPIPAS